jgi:hypothetical protein
LNRVVPDPHVRQLAGSRIAWWLLLAIMLTALQPFIAIHFRDDGWEDEPGFRIRALSTTVQFEPDERPDHAASRETTVFVPSGASIDLPNVFQHGLDGLMGLVLAMLPLLVALRAFAQPVPCALRVRVRAVIRAPPPTSPWRRYPPKTAPPLTT